MGCTLVTWGLTTIDDVKIYIGVSGVSYDEIFCKLINSSSSFLEKATDRKLVARTYLYNISAHREDAWYDGDSTNRLFTRQYPINSVSYLEIDGSELAAAGLTDYYGSTGYIIYNRRGELFYANGFVTGKQNVRISYNAGYASGTPEREELRELSNALVRYVYDNRDKLGFKSERIGNYSYSKGDLKAVEMYGVDGMAVINRYRRKFGGV